MYALSISDCNNCVQTLPNSFPCKWKLKSTFCGKLYQHKDWLWETMPSSDWLVKPLPCGRCPAPTPRSGLSRRGSV